MAKNLFEILPADFYKPLTSKYRRMYADAILLSLMDYFELDDDEISFDDETYVSDARDNVGFV